MVRSLAKHSGFFKKKDKNTIPETDMQENVAQMMEEPIDQDPVQELSLIHISEPTRP